MNTEQNWVYITHNKMFDQGVVIVYCIALNKEK